MKNKIVFPLNERYLIIDNAPELSESIKIQLNQIFTINNSDFQKFQFEFISSNAVTVLDKINSYNNIMVSTTFTTIRSNAVEDLMQAGIQYKLKNKNILSLMPFSVVGSSFENYENEVWELSKNNILFWFISENHRAFEKYQPKHN